jgi:hypothetical protein
MVDPIGEAANQGGDWFAGNAWWLILAAIGVVVLVLLFVLLKDRGSKRLQRDALLRLQQSLIKSARRSRGPARSVVVSGAPGDPPCRLGRYLGHLHGMDAVWIAYRPRGLLNWKPEVFAANPVDLGPLDVPEIQVRGLSVRLVRELGFVEPDVHDISTRTDWAKAQKEHYAGATEFAEAVKDYYSRAVDNLVAFWDALNAVEDRSFLRQEVTRSETEVTETITVPTASKKDATPEVTNRA